MYELELTKTFGRTGNTLLCVINALYFAYNNKIKKVKFHQLIWWTSQLMPGGQNELINCLEIDIDESDLVETTFENTDDERKAILKKRCSLIWNSEKSQFESWFCGFYLPDLSFDKRIYVAQKYIRPILNFKEATLNENDLVIHLRSGDIMDSGHRCYTQPPLCFYEEVINSKKWNNIYIITERTNNPCLSILENKYSNIITFIDHNKERHGGNGFGFRHDLGYLVGAHNFVPSQSSLSPLIIQLSKTIKNVYIPSYILVSNNSKHSIREHGIWWSNSFINKKDDFKVNNIQFHVLDYDKYIDTPEPIYNYHEQKFRDYLINYTN